MNIIFFDEFIEYLSTHKITGHKIAEKYTHRFISVKRVIFPKIDC